MMLIEACHIYSCSILSPFWLESAAVTEFFIALDGKCQQSRLNIWFQLFFHLGFIFLTPNSLKLSSLRYCDLRLFICFR
jgi:hypothetical protein